LFCRIKWGAGLRSLYAHIAADHKGLVAMLSNCESDDADTPMLHIDPPT